MFEAVIENTKRRLVEQLLLPSSGGLHLVQVLDHPSLDHAYKQFFRAELEWMLYQERIQCQANLPIEPTDPVFRRVYSQFEDYVRTHAWFDRKAAIGLIDLAVKSVLNYRLRPRVTLKWYVFRGEPTKPVCEILLRLQYFADYPYLHAGFEQWMQDRSLDEHSTHIMPIFEFERLVKQLDDDYILDLSTTEFIELLDPIFCFFNESQTPLAVQTIPIEALIVFLDDKDIQVIAQKLERMLYHDGVRSITREMILRVVDQVLQELEQQGQSSLPEEAESAPSNTILESSDIANDNAYDENDSTQVLSSEIEQPPALLSSAEHPEPLDEFDQEQLRLEASESQSVAERAQQDATSTLEHSLEKLTSTVIDTIEYTTGVEQPSVPLAHPFGEEEPQPIAISAADDAMLSSTAANATNVSLANQETAIEPLLEEAASPELYAANQLQQQESGEGTSGIEVSGAVAHSFEVVGESFLVAESADAFALEREFDLQQHAEGAPENQSVSPSATISAQEEEGIVPPPLSTDTSSDIPTSLYDEALETGLRQVRVQGELLRQSYPSLTSLLDVQLKEAVLNKLCARDNARYNELLARLEAAPSIRSALNELDRYCADYSVDPKSRVAQELRIVLVKRYTLA